MTTAQIIARLQRLSPLWSTQELLDLLDSLVKLFCRVENDDYLYYDTTTGDFPYLSTTAGTYNYTSIPNVWKIRDIVINKATYTSYGLSFPITHENSPFYANDPGDQYGYDVAEIKINNRLYRSVPCVKTEAYQGGTPSVMFRFDPGTQSSLYQIIGYKEPTTISSTSIALPIPVQYHETVVIPAIIALIDGMENGRYEEKLALVEDRYKAKIAGHMNKNSSDRLTFVAGGW